MIEGDSSIMIEGDSSIMIEGGTGFLRSVKLIMQLSGSSRAQLDVNTYLRREIR